MAMEDWRCKCGHMTYLHDHPESKPGLCHATPVNMGRLPVCKCGGYQPKNKKVRP